MIIELANTPRDYSWGSTTGIPEFLGIEPDGRPQAELWLGTHAGSPARAVRVAPDREERHPTLSDWLHAHPHLAGADAAAAGLPILLKLLSAESPLSLQVHPTLEQARAGFEDENARGIPVDDPARNYKDPFPKPEIIVAVSRRFDALCGFRPADEVAAIMAELEEHDVPATRALREILADPTRIGDALAWLLSGAPEAAECAVSVESFAQKEATATSPSAPSWATVREIATHYPGDPGIVVALVMNRVSLQRGQALFAPAGMLHAYLSGVGVELMIASDNVVRGGLTPKHIDTLELLRLLSFEQQPPELLEARRVAPGLVAYEPPAPFALWAADSAQPGLEIPLTGAALALVEGADVTLESSDASLTLPRGGAGFISPDESPLTVHGSGLLWLAVTSPDPAAQH
ncbi:mannose-6-phosphate isomerase, class I [Microbacterium sp. 4R-513]|uniref:mannose-6-phosphate isomerase, class I n=1 Tax=Microbacterium sp. 4R-513 TaxID=2567934 RepID=UPI0013E15D9B|nr:mannose-6-phosphate isomerase, class I [Microbacterium sp. 4R-513]QIG39365.1 mannose-6-phosphate isomerase, class I [Microbacterium sp. 4R-513]